MYDIANVDSLQHRAVALAAARKGMVLLQNGKVGAGVHLPLSKATSGRIAMLGPNANASMNLLSGYHGSPPLLVSPLQAMQRKWGAGNVIYSVGCNVSDVDNRGNITPPAIVQASIATAMAMARSLVLVCSLLLMVEQPTPYTLHRRACILHRTSCTLHCTLCTGQDGRHSDSRPRPLRR